MSVVLRQSHGFEGLFPHREEFDSRRPAVAHGPNMRDSYLDGRATTPGSGAHEQEDDDLIAALEELLRLSHGFLERSELILKNALDFLTSAIRPTQGVNVRHLVFEVRMGCAKCGIPVSAIGGLVQGAKRLNVCLRHRPRSIPQAQESA